MISSNAQKADNQQQYIIFSIGDQGFCLNVVDIQDVMNTPKLTKIPLASREIAGLLNLRGRIVTAVDLGVTLGGRPKYDPELSHMAIIIEAKNDLYSLLVDRIGEIIIVDHSEIETKTSAIDTRWQKFASGIYQYKTDLIVVLDTKKLLEIGDV